MTVRSPTPSAVPVPPPAPAGPPWRRYVLGAAWLYVAALWLLALDQTFHWGLFGPAVPPQP